MTRFLLVSFAFFALGCGASPKVETPPPSTAPVAAAQDPAKKQVLDDLMEAFNGESNASARYAEFAKKADAEGYKKAGTLFRAASKAEEIHAANHAKVIASLGGTPKADIKPAEVKSTLENLQAALQGETFEKETMYPKMLEHARAINSADAIRTLNGAMKAEMDHAALYAAAIANLDGMKAAGTALLVCPVCGHTVEVMTDPKCPICFTDKEKFLSVI